MGRLAYQIEAPADETKEEIIDESKRRIGSNKASFRLNLRNLESGGIRLWPCVTEYLFVEKNRKLVFVST